MYPKIIKGKLYEYRSALSYIFLLLFFSAPFLKVNGEQLILLDVLERKFVFFGVIFWPQDFYLFSVVGSARKPSSWRWYLEKLNFGLKVIISNKESLTRGP
jgi:polyferredoxin